jgi:soluble lytic murein transglycosylase-like protein
MNTIRQVFAGMVLIVLLAAGSPARAQSTVDLVNLFDGPCERYGVPKPLALAIAGHESGGRPWAMNIAGRPVLHASKEEALAVARAALAAGLSFDIGLMQINAQWLRRYRLPLELVFEPRGNVQVGVWILAQAIKRYGLTWEAVATYHTPLERNPERGRAYAAAVLARLGSKAPAMMSSSSANPRQVSPAASPMVVKRRDVASNDK